MAGQFRYVIVLLLFLGLVVDYMLQVSMSVTLICMINHTALRVKEQEAQRAAGSVGQVGQKLNGAAKTSQACNKDGGNGDTNVRVRRHDFSVRTASAAMRKPCRRRMASSIGTNKLNR